jgi:hypothetical protein
MSVYCCNKLMKLSLGQKPKLAGRQRDRLGLMPTVIGVGHQRHVAKQIPGAALANQRFADRGEPINLNRPPLE